MNDYDKLECILFAIRDAQKGDTSQLETALGLLGDVIERYTAEIPGIDSTLARPWYVGAPDPDGDGVTIESGEGPVAFRVIDCHAGLVAAAPDLLQVCQECAEHWHDTDAPIGARLRYAIAKATGGEA